MNPAPILVPAMPPAMIVHLLAALLAVALGAWQLLAPRAGQRHRGVGYAWAAAMLITALSSFWLTGPLGFAWLGGFSLIHGLSLWTLFALVMAVVMARKRRFADHQRWMKGSFTGLVIAGLFAALAPGRSLNTLLFSTGPALLASLGS